MDKMPCFANGEPLPATSGQFKIVNSVPLLAYPDAFPPNTSHGSTRSKYTILYIGLLLILFVLT